MKDTIVTICAIVGAVLGIFNFVKAWMQDKKKARVKADQRWMQARCRMAQTETGHVSETFVVNSGLFPVENVVVHFFADEAIDAEPVLKRKVGNLKSGQECHICNSGPGERGYKCAEFTYRDYEGLAYCYKDVVINQPSY